MTPERIEALRKALEVYTRDKESLRYAQMYEDMSARMTCQHDVEESESELAELLVEHAADLLATAEREVKLREAVKDYLKWVRTPHHHLPIEETVKQRREILERMEAALEQKGGES